MTNERVHELTELTLAAVYYVQLHRLRYSLNFSVTTSGIVFNITDWKKKETRYFQPDTSETNMLGHIFIKDPELLKAEAVLRSILEGHYES